VVNVIIDAHELTGLGQDAIEAFLRILGLGVNHQESYFLCVHYLKPTELSSLPEHCWSGGEGYLLVFASFDEPVLDLLENVRAGEDGI